MRQSALLILTLLWLAACKQAPKAPAPSSSAPPAAEAQPATSAAQPDVYWYVALVDKLNLRDQPNKAGKVLAQFAEAEIIEGTGKVSANKEDAVLRGISWTEPYVEIKYPTAGQPTGWAYSAALLPVFVGTRADAPDLGQLGKLSTHLKGLNTKNLESGKKAWDYVRTQMSAITPSTADGAFVMLEHFLSRMEREGEYYRITDTYEWTTEDFEAIGKRKYDINKRPTLKPLLESGFMLEEGEGMVFPVVDWNRLRDFFSAKVTPAMAAYIQKEAADRDKPAWSDGGVIISLEDLADRGAWWEKFNRDYPHFLMQRGSREHERWMRQVLVGGANNTPLYDYDTKAVSEEARKAWAYIQQKYPGTELARTTQEIADLCASEGWKCGPKADAYLKKFNESNQ
ncbi:MAG TPA: hypothetical protein PK971_12755 [Saprospiraceae bacterium]|nr:hypothetical protein [Saprospiraceae bacterium]